jgi:hypothetical protein
MIQKTGAAPQEVITTVLSQRISKVVSNNTIVLRFGESTVGRMRIRRESGTNEVVECDQGMRVGAYELTVPESQRIFWNGRIVFLKDLNIPEGGNFGSSIAIPGTIAPGSTNGNRKGASPTH